MRSSKSFRARLRCKRGVRSPTVREGAVWEAHHAASLFLSRFDSQTTSFSPIRDDIFIPVRPGGSSSPSGATYAAPNGATSNVLFVCYYKDAAPDGAKNKAFPRMNTATSYLKSSHHRLSRYGPLVVWATLIFIGSSSALSGTNTSVVLRPVLWLFPHASEATLALIHFLIRKAGHLTEYAILALLAARAFRTSTRELLRTRWFWVSLLFVVAYSLSDEFHQSFVPSRTASIYDSMIDSVGGFVALVLLVIRQRSSQNRER